LSLHPDQFIIRNPKQSQEKPTLIRAADNARVELNRKTYSNKPTFLQSFSVTDILKKKYWLEIKSSTPV